MTYLSEFVEHMASELGTQMTVQQDGETWLCAVLHETLIVGFRLAPGDARRWEIAETATSATTGQRLTPEAVRRVPLGRLASEAEDVVARMVARLGRKRQRKSGRAHLTGALETHLNAFLTGVRGQRISDVDYAFLAFEYVQLAREGNRSPAKYMSDRLGHGSPAQWSNRIGEARRRGLLSQVERGVAGGELTEKAEELLGL